ncbi:gamma-mobile-trio recombinase GmtY [Paraburkholderia caffeinitolerans]|nr:gamma-mobile-trio recombinase GmtY [Paraburkholderia caffeinitolerans]
MNLTQVKAKVVSDASGVHEVLPVLLTDDGPLEPLVDYFLWRRHDRSFAWMRRTAQAVRMFLQYTRGNAAEIGESERLFNSFARRLHSGTIGADGIDPSGLYWLPTSRQNAAILLHGLSDFFAWLSERRATANPNPRVASGQYDQMVTATAHEYRRRRAFLGYTWGPAPRDQDGVPALKTRGARAPKVDDAEAMAFPDRDFGRLLAKGFVRRGYRDHASVSQRLSLRDCLITLLAHGAGFRESECFHLYVHDVMEDPADPSMPIVRIHHPAEGEAPGDWLDERGTAIRCNRAAYLVGRYGLRPRNQLMGRFEAGWKDPMLDGRYFMQAFWFPSEMGRLFLHLWKLYLRQLAQFERNHPYAFISHSGAVAGEPYTLSSYNQAHSRAVQRIGLSVGKSFGTTPHGHRHAYGQRLRRAGVDPMFRKKALHHKALGSQVVYTAPSLREVNELLIDSGRKLDGSAENASHITSQFATEDMVAFGFDDVDPDGLISGPYPKLGRKP